MGDVGIIVVDAAANMGTQCTRTPEEDSFQSTILLRRVRLFITVSQRISIRLLAERPG